MIRYTFVCENEHQFETWFKNSGDSERQIKRNLVTCPVCGTAKVEKINSGKNMLIASLHSIDAASDFSKSFTLHFRARAEKLSRRGLTDLAALFKFRGIDQLDLFERPSVQKIIDRACMVGEREAVAVFSSMDWRPIANLLFSESNYQSVLESTEGRREINIAVSKQFISLLSGNRNTRGRVFGPGRKPFHGAFVTAAVDTVQSMLANLGRRPKENEKESIGAAQLERTISDSALHAPAFEHIRGRIRYRQARGEGQIVERRAAVRERHSELAQLCSKRANEQPELMRLSDRYGRDLRALRRDRGAYRLHLDGIDLEAFVRTHSSAPLDPERNPPLDADILRVIHSLLVSHAGLMSAFPDIMRLAEELDRYREQFEAIDALRDRVLEPALEQLSRARGVLDDQTRELTKGVLELQSSIDETTPTRAVVATKHGWLRGALAAIGHYILGQAKSVTKVARDSLIKEAIAQAFKDPKNLFFAIAGFLISAQNALIHLAEKLPISFGWILDLLKWLGLS
jgi:hypothetical protein